MQQTTSPAAFDADVEYAKIERALLDSARGRWFLAEHGRRARRLDSALLEDAIGRLQGSLRQPPALLGQLKAEVERIAADIAATRANLVGRQPQAPDAPAAPVTEILRAAETLHEKAWQLQAKDVDAERCETIARDASRIYAMSQLQAQESQRALSFAQALDRLDTALAAVMTTLRHEMEVDGAAIPAAPPAA